MLVVDDDDDVRFAVATILAEAGGLVLQVSSAREALDILRATPCIALLLTDIVMPGMNGVELAEAARALQPKLRVMFMTGYARYAPPRDACVLHKPFRARELMSAVDGALHAS